MLLYNLFQFFFILCCCCKSTFLGVIFSDDSQINVWMHSIFNCPWQCVHISYSFNNFITVRFTSLRFVDNFLFSCAHQHAHTHRLFVLYSELSKHMKIWWNHKKQHLPLISFVFCSRYVHMFLWCFPHSLSASIPIKYHSSWTCNKK